MLPVFVPQGMNSYQAFSQYPELFKRLEAVEADLAGGTTAVVALIVNNRLYLANVGRCAVAKLGPTAYH